jgi:predicted phosphate transport protein (TIGR00153 family)
MRVLFQDFLPNRELFYGQLDMAAKNAHNMATLLVGVVGTAEGEERNQLFKQVDKLEHQGDDITHKIYLALDRIVFTPLNRNDIHSLAGAIDDVADMIKEASTRINLYNITDISTPINELTGIIQKACAEIQKCVALLRKHQSTNDMLIALRQVKLYERQADRIYYNAVANLFLNDKDPINVIKYREILQSLENTINKCKSTADVLEVVLINR